MWQCLWSLLVAVVACAVVSPAAQAFGSALRLGNEDNNTLAAIRHAGLHRDWSQVPALIQAAERPPSRPYRVAALHALAQLGATAALPTLDRVLAETLATGTRDVDMNSLARVAKARLLAESAARGLADSPAAAARVARFYAELGLTREALNAAAGRRTQAAYQPQPLEVYAMREVADMVYQGNYADYAALPGVAQVDFPSDYPSALKMRLAPLARPDRIKELVDKLANKKTLGMNEEYDMQLLADENKAAGSAIVAKLQEMDAHRSSYTSIGFIAMFRSLAVVGDKDQALFVEHCMGEPDGFMKYFASEVYVDVEKGTKVQRAIGF